MSGDIGDLRRREIAYELGQRARKAHDEVIADINRQLIEQRTAMQKAADDKLTAELAGIRNRFNSLTEDDLRK
jgi:hypothetical protein